jgi:hypothetical protein
MATSRASRASRGAAASHGNLRLLQRSIQTPQAQFGAALEYGLDPDLIGAGVSVATLLDPNDFSTANWTKTAAQITPNATLAPDGTLTADLLDDQNNGVNNVHSVQQSAANFVTGVRGSLPIYIKRYNNDWQLIECGGSTGSVSVFFNAATGAAGMASGGATLSATDAGNGWWKVVVTADNPTTNVMRVYTAFGDGSAIYVANGRGVYLWGAGVGGVQYRSASVVDASGKGRTASEGTIGNQFEWRPSALLGRSALVARVAGKRLTTGSFGATLAQPLTNVVVVGDVSPDPLDGTRTIIDGIAAGNRHQIAHATSAAMGQPAGNSAVFAHAGSGTPFSVLNAGTLAAARAYRVEFNGASSQIFRDRGTSPIASGNAGAHSLTGLWIGADNAGTASFQGRLYYAMVVSRLFGAADLAWYQNWLGRWGIA